ncbi:rhomboid family protein [Thalassoroseus pseudoceratinae]|uniref:rhomboid family protein n=1 Tax=Thalassoroseus pseudoceratinae TaxID=2713176 RepID=UPI00141D805B|nr:rhomboid family intramembrane serine protease [Thalassoroseus pseudoceratinae]
MGFEDRDYVRGGRQSYTGSLNSGGGYGGYSGSGFPPVVKWIIIANVIVFALQVFWRAEPAIVEEVVQELQREIQRNPGDIRVERELQQLERARRAGQTKVSVIQNWFELAPDKATEGLQVWRFLTYAFLHSSHDIWHLVFNMMGLFFFGPTLERMLGSREFGFFYTTAAIVSGIAFACFGLFMRDLSPAIGASGAVVGVLALFAYNFPTHTILIWFFPVQARFLVVIYVIYDLYPVLRQLGGNPANDHIAHIAHLGGLVFGLAYGKFHIRLSGLTQNWRGMRLPKRKPKGVKLYNPVDEPAPKPGPRDSKLDESVDAILDKIHREGEASLTDREREILKEASQRYKKP